MADLNIKDFIEDVGKTNEEHGFHQVNVKPIEYLALIHSEVSETLEEFRSGHKATETYYREHDHKPEGVPSELADIDIRCFDMALVFGNDLLICHQRKGSIQQDKTVPAWEGVLR